MKALVYHAPGHISLDDKDYPVIMAATDAIVRITHTTICGTDLHILAGELPEVPEGRILGHEGVGIIDQVGTAVTLFKPGDAVVISCISACGICAHCKDGMYSHCLNGGGWLLGHLIDGTQAEAVRIPFAEHSLHPIPAGRSEEALVMLSDILPTGFEIGVLNGEVKPGDTVAIVGGGPIGLAALLTAGFSSPAETFVIDLDANRLEVARTFGATRVINNSDGQAAARVLELTGGRGVDVAMEAIGLPSTFDICQTIVAAGGHIANLGVHAHPVQLNMDHLWSHNITLTTGLVDTDSTPLLIRSYLAGKVDPRPLITHHFPLGEILDAYDTFGHAMREHALKVIISVPPPGAGPVA